MDSKALLDAVAEFVEEVDGLYGVYLDATAGFLTHHQKIVAFHAQPLPGITDQESLPFYIGARSPMDPDNRLHHTTTQGEYKRRNARGGSNYVQLGRMLVVLIYELWEAGYRSTIAAALEIPRDKLTSDLFGDLRHLRNSALHCKGVVRVETLGKLRTITGLAPGPLTLNEAQVELLVRSVKREMDDLVKLAGLPDPAHRTVWHLKT